MFLKNSNITDFGTATVLDTKSVKQIWNKDRPRVVPDSRYADRGDGDGWGVFVVVPIKTINPLNVREHWSQRSRRANAEKDATILAFQSVAMASLAALAEGCVITLTRVSRRRLSEDEGLRASLKHVRDQIAVILWGGKIGERDDDERGEWRYGQLAGKGLEAAVTISIRKR